MEERKQVRVEESGNVRGWFRVESRIFKDAEAKVRVSASKDETRPVLTGVLVSVEGHRVRMVSTDSYRLTIKESDLSMAPDSDVGEVVIPADAMRHVSRIVRAWEEVEVVISGSEARFRLPNMTLAVRLLAGNFPEYRRLLPEGYEREVLIPCEEIMAALKRLKPSRRHRSSMVVPVKLTFAESSLELLIDSEEHGEARETAAAKVVKGEGFAIGFNPAFLLDALSVLNTEVARMQCNGALQPVMFTPGSAQGEADHRHLLMPMRWALRD